MITKTKNITLFEYWESQAWELDPSDIFEVQKINKAIWVNLFEIKANNTIKAKQYLWILRVNNKNIQVLPKIFWEDDNEKCNKYILRNLLYMLSYTKKLQIKESDIAKMWEINNLFEIYIYLFANDLVWLLKKDFKKSYNDIEENSSFLKWRLLFAQHITHNIFNKSKFFIEYEKMDENILLNIFLHSACKKLLKETNSETNYQLLNKCCFILKDIDSTVFRNSKTLNRLNFNKQNKDYKKVFTLGKMLYFWSSPDFHDLKNDNYSFMFDMNVLFEEFIVEFMKKNQNLLSNNILKIYSQVQNKTVFNENKFKLKPDILVEYSNWVKLVIDTKYKKLYMDKPYYWVSSSDIYQMFMYWMRYYWEYNKELKKNIILLYPKYNNEEFKTEYISEENIIVQIRTINLNYNLNSEKWKNNILLQINELLAK